MTEGEGVVDKEKEAQQAANDAAAALLQQEQSGEDEAQKILDSLQV